MPYSKPSGEKTFSKQPLKRSKPNSASDKSKFDLYAQKEWPARDVAKSLGVTVANVYVTKHRISAALRKEMEKMERTIPLARVLPEGY